ncbi:MAG: hypothetical protein ABIF11_06705 [Nitrospirota bacterium]
MDNLPKIEKWFAQNLRLTVFPAPTCKIESLPKWEETLGELPEQSNTQPKAKILEETGKFGKGALSLKFVPGRIDWHYMPIFLTDKIAENLPNIGQFVEAIELFKPVMVKWLESCGPLTRLAFGTQINLPTENHKDAYLLLNEYLHYVELDPNSSDFSYSINRIRPYKRGIPDLKINRLSRWGAMEVVLKSESLESDPVLFVSVDLDINTVPIKDLVISKEYFNILFNELIEMAIEIAEKGDIS